MRAQVRAGAPCWCCGYPIDLGLPARHPLSFSVDHVVELQHGGAPLEASNLRPAHLSCNVARSNRARGQARRRARRTTTTRQSTATRQSPATRQSTAGRGSRRLPTYDARDDELPSW